MDTNQVPPVIDIISRQTTYVHFSLADGRVLIFDISDCSYIATGPSQDGTLTGWKDGEKMILKPIRLPHE